MSFKPSVALRIFAMTSMRPMNTKEIGQYQFDGLIGRAMHNDQEWIITIQDNEVSFSTTDWPIGSDPFMLHLPYYDEYYFTINLD